MFSKQQNAQKQFTKINQQPNPFAKMVTPQRQQYSKNGHFFDKDKKTNDLEKQK